MFGDRAVLPACLSVVVAGAVDLYFPGSYVSVCEASGRGDAVGEWGRRDVFVCGKGFWSPYDRNNDTGCQCDLQRCAARSDRVILSPVCTLCTALRQSLCTLLEQRGVCCL